MADQQFRIEWQDSGREPQCQSDPNFPDGKDIDVVLPGYKGCKVLLPYPAKRCGMYFVECFRCKCTVAITTAGRRDDPRSVRIQCKRLPW